jgi:site-specific DNA recombinase
VNQNDTSNITFGLYVRKSGESEDRQVQSIDDQVAWGGQTARLLGLTIRETYIDERSAKEPGRRADFDRMLADLQSGKINGILTWQINRLSRNPVESGSIQWLLQQDIIRVIKTSNRDYLPTDNALLFSVETATSNQYILDLQANVRRGMSSKVSKGWYPHFVPQGYLNDKAGQQGNRQVFVDGKRWHHIRHAWELMLTENYNPSQVLDIIHNNGFRTRPTPKRPQGGLLSRSGIYKILTNVFYTGMFEYHGVLVKGSHKAMVTLDEFNLVQRILGNRGRPRPQKREFAYTGLIRCGQCQCLVTAETKTKYVKSTGQAKEYTYYRCTKSSHRPCTERPIRLSRLEAQIAEELAQLTILPEFRDWALDILRRENKRELDYRTNLHKDLARRVQDMEKEFYNLNTTYMRGVLDDDFYTAEKNRLKDEITNGRTRLENSRDIADNFANLCEHVFKFANAAADVYRTGDIRTKRDIFSALGGSFTLLDGKLSYRRAPWFEQIAQDYPRLEDQFKEIRTKQNTSLSLEAGDVLSQWYGCVIDIRTLVRASKVQYIPSLEEYQRRR